MNKKIIIDVKPKIPIFPKETAHGNKNAISRSKIINNIDQDTDIKSDLLYRRGGSFERKEDYKNADKDLLESLSINPDDAYVLNYLAYSWLERNFKIDQAITMLEKAYNARSDDPYIIDSLGWAYYLTSDFQQAENYLKRAVEFY